MQTIKDYLGFELNRNHTHAALYTRLLHIALDSKSTVAVLIGHHLTFMLDGDLQTENEVPSADCLIFDHELMTAVFGDKALGVMVACASVPCDQRDEVLRAHLDAAHPVQAGVSPATNYL